MHTYGLVCTASVWWGNFRKLFRKFVKGASKLVYGGCHGHVNRQPFWMGDNKGFKVQGTFLGYFIRMVGTGQKLEG